MRVSLTPYPHFVINISKHNFLDRVDFADVVSIETIEIVDMDTGLLNLTQAVAYKEGEGCEASANHLLFIHSRKDNIQSFVQQGVQQSDPGVTFPGVVLNIAEAGSSAREKTRGTGG